MTEPRILIPTRTDLLRRAELLRRAAGVLEAHARACPIEAAPAHAEALRQAQAIARRVVVDTGEGKG
jgi:hypothetical protein